MLTDAYVGLCGLQQSHVLPGFDVFFFNDPATTEIYTLSLHDALPISLALRQIERHQARRRILTGLCWLSARSEEHTSELQSHVNLVCRLLLEKKKTHQTSHEPTTDRKVPLTSP